MFIIKPFSLNLFYDDDVELHVLGCRVDILGTNYDQCVSIVQYCFTSTETIRLIRTEKPKTATSTLTQPRLLHSLDFHTAEL